MTTRQQEEKAEKPKRKRRTPDQPVAFQAEGELIDRIDDYTDALQEAYPAFYVSRSIALRTLVYKALDLVEGGAGQDARLP